MAGRRFHGAGRWSAARRRTALLLAAAAAAEALAGGWWLVARPVGVPDAGPVPAGQQVRGRAAGGGALAAPSAAGLRRLLTARARALDARDPAALAATADPAVPRLRDHERAVATRLLAVPATGWSFTLDGDPTPAGPSRWRVAVLERYHLSAAGRAAVAAERSLTLTYRGHGRGAGWYVAADPPRDPWDFGPVVAVRSGGGLVVVHPGAAAAGAAVSRTLVSAVRRVTAVWGRAGWAGTAVVLVPADQHEADTLSGTAMESLAASTVAVGRSAPVVVLDPAAYAGLSPAGRLVVLTHELTHVATWSAAGPGMPEWLDEGFADYVGFRGSRFTVPQAAAELAARVDTAGPGAVRLPTAADFRTAGSHLAASYEAAWLACRAIAQRWGQPTLLRLFRTVGAAGPGTWVTAFTRVLHVTPAAFTAQWRHDVLAELR